MIVCFVKHFETVVWSINIYFYIQFCSRPLDWQLEKKCFETCGILIFVSFCFNSMLPLVLKLHRTIFCHLFSAFSHANLLSGALTVMLKLTKMVLTGVPL